MNKQECCWWKDNRVKVILKKGLLISVSELSQVMEQKGLNDFDLHVCGRRGREEFKPSEIQWINSWSS